MALRTGFETIVCKLTMPSVASAATFTNGGLAITRLEAGRYLVICNTAIDPVNAGANLTGTTAIVTQTALFGVAGAIGLCQLQVSATNAADINSRHSSSNIVNLVADADIFVYVQATTSAGNWQGSILLQDSLCNQISFLKLQ
jgi:hypothetical protein